jgi:hypothetical protein
MRQAAAYVRWAYGHLSRSQRDAKEPAEYLVGRICEENSGHRIGVRGIPACAQPANNFVAIKFRVRG